MPHTPPQGSRPRWPSLSLPTPMDVRCQCGQDFGSHASRWPHKGFGCDGFVPSEPLAELSGQVHGKDHRRRWIFNSLRYCGPSTMRFALPYGGRFSFETRALGAAAVDVTVYQSGVLIARWFVEANGVRSCLVEVEDVDLAVRVQYAENDQAERTEPYGILPPGKRKRSR